MSGKPVACGFVGFQGYAKVERFRIYSFARY